jgi:hypothetical protein
MVTEGAGSSEAGVGKARGTSAELAKADARGIVGGAAKNSPLSSPSAAADGAARGAALAAGGCELGRAAMGAVEGRAVDAALREDDAGRAALRRLAVAEPAEVVGLGTDVLGLEVVAAAGRSLESPIIVFLPPLPPAGGSKFVFHTMTISSSPPLAKISASGENATVRTPPLCP